MKGILGHKIGMTEVFTKDGKAIPVTVIKVEPNTVTQVKTIEKDGYNAVQIATTDKKEKHSNKAEIGHAKKANTNPKRFLKEIRDIEGNFNLGDVIKADIFAIGESIDVTGTSKGKGFEGVIKRHNQSRGPMTHGSRYHRGPGSMGSMRPMRVMKGKNLPGHMGNETVTIQNLEVIDINLEDNYILVSGNVPGPKRGLVLIKSAVKKPGAVNAQELLSYEELTVVDEIVEENNEPIVETTEDTTIEEQTTVETEETTQEAQEEAEASSEVSE